MIEINPPGLPGKSDCSIYTGDVMARLPLLIDNRRVIVITDENVLKIYGDRFLSTEVISVPAGERTKTLATIEYICGKLIEMNADRNCFLLGFGGGVVTDITGFSASVFMRGIPFGFVATTLMAQVDAAIGGKNGVNVNRVKNIAGNINQPEFVLCPTSLLTTLPDSEFVSAISEMIKCGILSDRYLFAMFEQNTIIDFRNNVELLSEAIERSLKVKLWFVERDEKDHGVRRKLNLGHTFAHAIEALTDRYNHGQAVALGIRLAAKVSLKSGYIEQDYHDRINRVLSGMSLPEISGLDARQIVSAAGSDKKKSGENLMLILPSQVNGCLMVEMSKKKLVELVTQ